MGVSKILSPIANLFGGAEKPKAQPVIQQPKVEDTKTASEIAAEEDQKKKAALVALNASGGTTAPTVGGASANVTRKTLLGL